nr:hypothetical protein [Mimivirus sp.]
MKFIILLIITLISYNQANDYNIIDFSDVKVYHFDESNMTNVFEHAKSDDSFIHIISMNTVFLFLMGHVSNSITVRQLRDKIQDHIVINIFLARFMVEKLEFADVMMGLLILMVNVIVCHLQEKFGLNILINIFA